MGFLSRLKEYGSNTINWAKEKPVKAVSRSVISILAGVGVGFILAPASLGVGIACGIGFGIGAALSINNDEIKIYQDKIIKTVNVELVTDKAKTTLDQTTARTIQALNETALNKNAQTISDKDAEILILKTALLAAKAKTANIVQPVSPLNCSLPLNEKNQVSNQSMFNSNIRKRGMTKTSNVASMFKTDPSFVAPEPDLNDYPAGLHSKWQ